jgi:hypothetical protein
MRLSRIVDNHDIELAVKLLRTTIFMEDMGLGDIYPIKEEDQSSIMDEPTAEKVVHKPSFSKKPRNMGNNRCENIKKSDTDTLHKKPKPDLEE